MVRTADYSLAFETSCSCASVALGRGSTCLDEVTLPPPRRHRVDLMPAVDDLCRRHGVVPANLGELYVSSGPGSFTGLRIGIATAKALALALDLRLVRVPTLEALAAQAAGHAAAAVCLNLKRDTMYCAVYERRGDAWQATVEPALRTLDDLLLAAPRPVVVVGDPLPSPPRGAWPRDVSVLDGDAARPRAAEVWRLGYAAARAGEFVDPDLLQPLYARPPEAVELWQARHGTTRSSTEGDHV